MDIQLVEKIENNPKYIELVSKRSGFAIKLSIFVLVMFYSYILTIAFNPSLLAIKTSEGVMTVAFPIAAVIILISFITTLIYVSKANGEYEDLTNEIKDDVKGML